MARYRCRIGTQDQRVEERVIVASSAAALARTVEGSGQFLLDARRQFSVADLLAGEPARDEVALALKQIALLARNGVEIGGALAAVGNEIQDEGLRAALVDVAGRVGRGTAVAVAFEAHPEVFDPLLVAAVRGASDRDGLCRTLERRADALLETEEFSRKVKTAAAYPALLIAMSTAVLSFLIGYVVPSIGRLFAESGTKMPWATRATLAVAGAVRGTATLWVPAVAIVICGAALAARTARGARLVDRIVARLPIAGLAWTEHPWTAWAFSVADALGAGLALPRALMLGASTVTRAHLADALARVAGHVEHGSSIAAALERESLRCPPLLRSALGVQTSAADLGALLTGAARAEAARVQWALTRLSRTVEPLMLIVVGAVVGAIVISLYLPILSLVDTL